MEFKDLLGIGMTIIVLVIGLAYGLQVTTEVGSDIGEQECRGWFNSTSQTCQNASGVVQDFGNGLGYNATAKGKEAVAKIPNKLGTIVTVILASVVLGILVRYLWGNFVQPQA